MSKFTKYKELEKVNRSAICYVIVNSKNMAMFRFLLEAYDNLALMTVLEPKMTLVKLLYSSHEQDRLRQCLKSIQTQLDITYIENPF